MSLRSRLFFSSGRNFSNDRQFSRYLLSLLTLGSTATSLGMGLFFDVMSRSFSASLAASWFFHASSTYTVKIPFAISFATNDPLLSSAYPLRRCAFIFSLFDLFKTYNNRR